MGDLTRRSRPSAPQARGADTGADGNVDDINFNKTATTFGDLGLPSPDFQQGVLASGVRTEGSRVRRRRSEGTYFRRAIAWTATRQRILIHRMEQPLTRREDGRFQPSGQWVKSGSVLREAPEPAAVRRGEVPYAPQTGGESDSGDSAGDGEDRFAKAYSDLSVLPRPVRRSVLNRAVNPDHFYTLLLQHERNGTVRRHSLNLIRANPSEGIVVVASRAAGASTWRVEQYTYDFSQNAAGIGAGSGPGLSRGRHGELT
ncbi:MAG TPA: hypothetical protein VK063_07635 [Beutenbergiaceae bacterium]|nr:hypothetical protein [Beutenbergiaceae bacterium]